MGEQLKGVQNWLVHLDAGSEDLSTLNEIAAIASKSSNLENLSVLLSNANELDVSACMKDIKSFDEISSLQYTIVAVGKLEDHNEGSRPYKIHNFGEEDGVIPADAVYSRDESMRLITESLALGNTARKALIVTECATDDVAAKLVKGLRQAGYSRSQEIDHMVMKGVKAYDDAIEEYKKKKFDKENPDPEEMRRIQEERDAQAKLDWEKTEKEFEERKEKEIEDHAKTWAKREYFRRSMGGNMGMTEEEFIKSVWERAMFEGDLKYRMMRGGKTDERKELAEFIKKQEVKKEAALKKAKAKLEESLGSEQVNVNGEDEWVDHWSCHLNYTSAKQQITFQNFHSLGLGKVPKGLPVRVTGGNSAPNGQKGSPRLSSVWYKDFVTGSTATSPDDFKKPGMFCIPVGAEKTRAFFGHEVTPAHTWSPDFHRRAH